MFVSPEASRAYQEYRNLRIKFGEQITKNSPILLRRFDLGPDGKTARIDNTEPIALSTVAGIIGTVAYKAGVRASYYKGRYNIKIANGFRKFFLQHYQASRQKMGERQSILSKRNGYWAMHWERYIR